MEQRILDHYLQFSTFTNPGCDKDFLVSLPSDVKELGNLISHQIIHRVTLKEGNTIWNTKKKFRILNSSLISD